MSQTPPSTSPSRRRANVTPIVTRRITCWWCEEPLGYDGFVTVQDRAEVFYGSVLFHADCWAEFAPVIGLEGQAAF